MLNSPISLLGQLRELNESGVNRDILAKMYNDDNLTIGSIAKRLTDQFDTTVNIELVNALFEYFSIQKHDEKRRYIKKAPINKNGLQNKIELIQELGFDRDTIEALYSGGMSKNAIISQINSSANSNAIHKTWLRKMFELWGVESRDRAEMDRNRIAAGKETWERKRLTESMYGNGHTRQELIDLYNTGASLAEIQRKTGTAPVTTAKALKESGIEIRKLKTYKETLDNLESKGISRDEISFKYLEENLTQTELLRWMNEFCDWTIPMKSCRRITDEIKAIKSLEKIKIVQGRDSRAEFSRNLNKLRRAGFESLSDLAKHYDDNKSLTKRALLKQLNSKLDPLDYPFTERWLGRHMDPHLPEDRLKGTSRIEKEFTTEFTKLLDVNEITILNSFSIISPYQLDVYLPNLNLAVEFNGDYWHSDRFMLKNHGMTARAYHEMKLARCEELGIRLLFVWECDWLGHREEVITALEEVLNNTSRNKIEPEILSVLSLDELFEAEEEIDAA